MVFDPPAKSRRRVLSRLLWPLLIVVALIFALVVTAAGESTRVEIDYLDQVSAQSADLSLSGSSLRELMPRLREIDRKEFITVFDNLDADLDVAQEFVADDPPAQSLVPVWALYRQAVAAWTRGADGLERSLLQAADNPQDETMVNAVGDSLAELRAGDQVFAALLSEFGRDEIPTPVVPPVEVVLMPTTEVGLLSLSETYVAAARSSTNTLGLRPGLRLSQITSDPAWQLNVDGKPVIPATETVTFAAVVTNSGNVRSTPETVDMTLTGGPEPLRVQQEIPQLDAGAQTTITFDPVTLEPETLYQVEMELAINGVDSDLTDNRQVVQFTINPG